MYVRSQACCLFSWLSYSPFSLGDVDRKKGRKIGRRKMKLGKEGKSKGSREKGEAAKRT
jgi:hypothetical protein